MRLSQQEKLILFLINEYGDLHVSIFSQILGVAIKFFLWKKNRSILMFEK